MCGVKPERLIALVVYHPLMHVGFMNLFTLCAIYAAYAYVHVRIITNWIAAKILQQNNFGISKFPDQPFCVGLGMRLAVYGTTKVLIWQFRGHKDKIGLCFPDSSSLRPTHF